MAGKAPSKSPIVTFSTYECIWLAKQLEVVYSSSSTSTNHTTPLNKSIRGMCIACCALRFEFLSPNDVLIFCFVLVVCWVFFNKKTKQNKNKPQNGSEGNTRAKSRGKYADDH